MDKPGAPKTIGQAIDAIIEALEPLEEVSRLTAIKAACDHLKIPAQAASAIPLNPAQTPAAGGDTAPLQSMGIQALKEQKQPTSANEMASLVAFYLSELAPKDERKTEVQVEDMVKYFKLASFPLPKQPRVLLANAKNAGYFDAAEHGKYRLNAVGYNLVAHNLPRRSGEAAAPRRARRKRTSPKAARKARKASQPPMK